MAYNLIISGLDVIVYDIVVEKTKNLVKAGAKLANTLQKAIDASDVIISMLPDDKALKSIVLNTEAIVAFKDKIHISMSTVSPNTITDINDFHEKNSCGFLSCPVLGRPEAAISRKLWFFLSGYQEIKKKIRPILNILGQRTYDFGIEITAASKVKLAINFLILSAIEAMGEAFTLIEKNGIDRRVFADMITETLFSCKAYRYHAESIAHKKFDPAGFRVSLGLKDIDLVLNNAHQLNCPMPLANLLQNRLLTALAKNRHQLDWSSITLGACDDSGLPVS